MWELSFIPYARRNMWILLPSMSICKISRPAPWNSVISNQILQHITDISDILLLYTTGQLDCSDVVWYLVWCPVGHTVIPFEKYKIKIYLLLVFRKLLSGTLCTCIYRNQSILSFVISFLHRCLFCYVVGILRESCFVCNLVCILILTGVVLADGTSYICINIDCEVVPT
jgi:hypothetical protein